VEWAGAVCADGLPAGRARPRLPGPGMDEAAGGEGVFRQLALARIIEPASEIDSFEPTQAGNVGSAACAS
jgi:hypothetical protein